ncbi:protein G12-like [Osmia bicornis bicornis]|uniref:protein G12-like n=1 Tax=Osmia bicornis bicornis TaxID=1437191 RepID=UPI001EAF6BA1|nr:protein G12-like [Osmia bicornis bicornis]
MRISAFKILITFLTLLTFTQVKISYLTIKFPNILFARSSRYNLIEDSLTEGVFKGRKRFSVMHSVKSTSRSNMMKFAFALVAVLALASPLQAYNVPRTGTGVLADDVQEFVDLLPMDEVIKIIHRYVTTDSDVQAVIKFMHSNEFKQLVTEIETMSEIQHIMNYMQKNGLDIYQVVNHINKYLDLEPLTPPTNVRMVRAAGGIRGMLDEVKALVPKEKIRELYKQKLATSKVFAELVAQVKSPEFQNVANKLCDNATFKHMLSEAKKAQVDVEGVISLIENRLGVKIPCRV